MTGGQWPGLEALDLCGTSLLQGAEKGISASLPKCGFVTSGVRAFKESRALKYEASGGVYDFTEYLKLPN